MPRKPTASRPAGADRVRSGAKSRVVDSVKVNNGSTPSRPLVVFLESLGTNPMAAAPEGGECRGLDFRLRKLLAGLLSGGLPIHQIILLRPLPTSRELTVAELLAETLHPAPDPATVAAWAAKVHCVELPVDPADAVLEAQDSARAMAPAEKALKRALSGLMKGVRGKPILLHGTTWLATRVARILTECLGEQASKAAPAEPSTIVGFPFPFVYSCSTLYRMAEDRRPNWAASAARREDDLLGYADAILASSEPVRVQLEAFYDPATVDKATVARYPLSPVFLTPPSSAAPAGPVAAGRGAPKAVDPSTFVLYASFEPQYPWTAILAGLARAAVRYGHRSLELRVVGQSLETAHHEQVSLHVLDRLSELTRRYFWADGGYAAPPVRFMGRLPQGRLPSLLREAAAAIVIDSDESSILLAEALGCGVPVLSTTRESWFSEAEPHVTVIERPLDPRAWEDAFCNSLHRPKGPLTRVHSLFSWTSFHKALVDCYTGALSAAGRRTGVLR